MINVSQVDITEEQIKAVIGVAVGTYLNNAVKTGKMTQQELAQLSQAAEAGASDQGAAMEPPNPGGPAPAAAPGIAAPQSGGIPNV